MHNVADVVAKRAEGGQPFTARASRVAANVRTKSRS
jgi:hypothetical protein